LRGQGPIFGGVQITAPRAELHQSLDTYAQGFQLLTDDGLWYLPEKFLDEETYLPILGEGKSVKTHTFAPI
jgi:hypothetical protein